MAGAALQHFREERAGEQHRRLEVDAQGALHLLGGELGEPARAGEPGVGDEDVDARGRRGEPLRLTVLGEVGDDDAVAGAGQALGQRQEVLLAAPAQYKGGAVAGEALGDRPTEAAGGPGKKCCAPGNLHSKGPIY